VAVLLGIAQAPSWGWTDPTVIGLFVLGAVLLWAWVVSESRSPMPLVDMTMMRVPTVWATNLAAILFGFGMFSFFVTVPQFVQTPASAGYGFGASVTQSGLYLVPYAATMLVLAPAVGRLSLRVGSKPILIVGSLFAAASYGVLAAAHSSSWTLYLASGLLGVGMALGYTAMANLIVEAVRADQTGVATGMNTNIRNIGSALGSGVATSFVVSTVGANGYPTVSGYTRSFIVAGISLVVAAAAALKIPRRVGDALAHAEDHPGLVAEAEVFVGADAYRAEA
jgi:MFS family permease